MGEVAPQTQPGYSARPIIRAFGVPTHNKRLQNVEHGLAVRDKLRIINYIQAKPQRKPSTSPVSPHFQSLAEELIASATDMMEVPSPDPEDRSSPPQISTGLRVRHRSGPDTSSQSQVGFSARKLSQPRLIRRNSSTSSQGSTSPDLQSQDSKTKPVGFSARNLPQGSGLTTSSKPPGLASRARANSSPLDAVLSDSGPRMEPCGTPEVDVTGGVSQTSPEIVSKKNIDTPLKTEFVLRSPSPVKFNFAIKSPSSDAMSPLGVSARTKKNIVTKTAARKEWRNSNRPGLSSPTPSDCSGVSDTDVQAKPGPNDDPCGTPHDVKKETGQRSDPRVTPHDVKKERVSPILSQKAGFSARSLAPQGPVVNARCNAKFGPTIDPCGTQDSGRNTQPSPVIGFSARNPPPGLSLGAAHTAPHSVKPRSRHLSTPASIGATRPTSQSAPIMRSLSADIESAHKILSNVGPSALQTVTPPPSQTVTPPPGFSARNPPPGFSTRSAPPGFGNNVALTTGPSTKVASSNPPPGLVGRDKKTTPPPGFRDRTPTKSTSTDPTRFQLNFKSTSPVQLPQNQALTQNNLTSPTLEKNSKKSPITSPDDAKSQANGSVVRFARQQIRPYSKQKDTAAAPSTTASPDKVKRTLASAKEELEVIKKIHLRATNMIPPHVQKLAETLERIGARYNIKGSSGDTKKVVLDQNDNVTLDDDKTGASPSVQVNGDNAMDRVCTTPDRIGNDLNDDEVATADKVKKATWRAISVNHAFLSSGVPQQFSFGVHAICDVLRTHGKEQDEYNKDGMDKVFVTIRNIILDHSKKVQLRKELLELVELRARKWPKQEGQIRQVVRGLSFANDVNNNTQNVKRGLWTPPKNSHPRLRRSLSDSETTVLRRQFHDIRIEAPSQVTNDERDIEPQRKYNAIRIESPTKDTDNERRTAPQRKSNAIRIESPSKDTDDKNGTRLWRNAVPIEAPGDESKAPGDESDDTASNRLQRKSHAIPIEVPHGASDDRENDGLQRRSHAIPIESPTKNVEGTAHVISPLRGAGDKNSQTGSKHKDRECKKYSREFLLSCYDSSLTKNIPIMLHYTFMNSDTGFIVDRNDEDPRDLIRATCLPPQVKSISGYTPVHTVPMRAQRLNSWPGPAFSSIPEASQPSNSGPPPPDGAFMPNFDPSIPPPGFPNIPPPPFQADINPGLDMAHGFVHHIRNIQLKRDDYDKEVTIAKQNQPPRRQTPAPTRPRKPDMNIYMRPGPNYQAQGGDVLAASWSGPAVSSMPESSSPGATMKSPDGISPPGGNQNGFFSVNKP